MAKRKKNNEGAAEGSVQPAGAEHVGETPPAPDVAPVGATDPVTAVLTEAPQVVPAEPEPEPEPEEAPPLRAKYWPVGGHVLVKPLGRAGGYLARGQVLDLGGEIPRIAGGQRGRNLAVRDLVVFWHHAGCPVVGLKGEALLILATSEVLAVALEQKDLPADGAVPNVPAEVA